MEELKKDINCNIWLTIESEDPDFEDIANLIYELEDLGINYKGKLGVGFMPNQWINFLHNMSRFEKRISGVDLGEVMGLKVRLIHPIKGQN